MSRCTCEGGPYPTLGGHVDECPRSLKDPPEVHYCAGCGRELVRIEGSLHCPFYIANAVPCAV